jgi:hypothetical protein
MESTDIGLYVGYAVFLVAVGAAIIFPLINALKTPADLLKSLAGVGVLVVVFGIAYALSGSEISVKAAAMDISASSSKLIGAGLITFYIVLILSVLGIVFSEINKALK